MTRSLCTALLALAFLPGCASVSTNTAGGNATVASGTYYCWKDKFYEEGGQLMCNWTDSVKSACELGTHRALPKSEVTSGLTQGKRCANGQELIQITMK